MSEMDMVERVARALCSADGRDPDELHCGSLIWEAHSEGFLEFPDYEAMAHAAIGAMREPTPEMIEAGLSCPIVNYDGNDPKQVWEAMIAAALSPSGEK